MRDPYSILGVRRDAGSDEIKAAWRSKAKTSHPDQNRDDPNATQRFAEIGQAYDLLKDKEKRSRYDQRLSQMEAMKREQTIMQQREEARAAAERARQAKANAERIMADLAKIEAERAKAEKAAEALNAKVESARAKAKAAEAQAETAAKAQSSAQNPNSQQNNTTTSGPADAAPADPAAAASANGAEHVDASADNKAQTDAPLNARSDSGKKPDDSAAADSAPGGIFALPVIGLISSLVRRIRKPAPVLEKAPDIMAEATIAIDDLLRQNTISLHLSDGRDIRLPLEPGHTDGTIVRLEGKGLKIPGMLTGDVLASLRVMRTGACTVDGYDIHTVLKLPLEDAVLGCDTTIEGPSGPVQVSIPAWSGSDQSIRLENQGLPISENERGALVVDIRITLAETPNEKLRDLMKVMKHGLFL